MRVHPSMTAQRCGMAEPEKRKKWRMEIVATQCLGEATYTLYTFEGTDEDVRKEMKRLRSFKRPCMIEGIWLKETDLLIIHPDYA